MTDIGIFLSEFIVDSPMMIRSFNVNTSIKLILSNRNGATVDRDKPMAEVTGPNFQLSMWISDSSGLASVYNQTVWTAEYNLTLPQWEDLEISETFALEFSADICYHAKYLCVGQRTTQSNVYRDTNITNDVYCQELNVSILCNPGKIEPICIFSVNNELQINFKFTFCQYRS